ncbi:MAG: alcohol dehydrogenase catalytic domain-containing protein [bacterium]|nr:alcohol dehydrogenase catalytic domain-containing protein [bacterium]
MSQPAVVHFALKERSVELRDIDIPAIRSNQVLMRVAAVGVCGTDVHQYLNEHSWPVQLPVVMCHEFSGIIEEVGKRVTEFAPGDRVVSETAAFICGECHFCRTGRYHLCPHRVGFGQGKNGGLTQLVAVPARCLHRVPNSIPMHHAALSEPVCVAYHAVAHHANVQIGSTVAVLGCGAVGLLCVQMAKRAGAESLLLTGLSRDVERMALGRTFGATHTVCVDNESLRERVREIGDGLGLDYVIDASGRNASLKDAVDIVRPGGTIVRVGWGPGPYNFSLDPLVHKEVRLQGAFSHTWEMWERVIKLMASGVIDVSLLAPSRLPLEKWRDGFEGMHDASLIKAVIEPNGPMD